MCEAWNSVKPIVIEEAERSCSVGAGDQHPTCYARKHLENHAIPRSTATGGWIAASTEPRPQLRHGSTQIRLRVGKEPRYDSLKLGSGLSCQMTSSSDNPLRHPSQTLKSCSRNNIHHVGIR